MVATDEALLAGMAAGDPLAAAAFVRRYQARVFGLALTIVGVRATAEDVAQEAFTRAWRYAPGYDPRRGAVSAWLLTIARNAAVDVLRTTRDQPYDPATLVDLVTARPPAGEAPADAVADRERLRTALRSLPAEQAQAVLLAAYYGLTAREIAERDGLPLGTVKTRIRLGLGRLRDLMEVRDG
ncbi:RNA polymerase sigma factor [Asanoa iriomotensis]|uniref:DNA-directed RNA polymerase sigma-70 factor n=1 Tax=Asanoa iriomotensis TaxID=234613 RepID=A0ABQ4BTQ8_9ACTN|nr:sigma-70 family RNA polymerase sigma factor [Asanoa iriomotensis]GIF53911.1 DNA-directed RNA polymerase sigma-70 factor [Asanoa iriomotensis]